MDNSRKPEHRNPKQGANLFSQLFFLWMFPTLFQGARKGLNTNDLTQCLNKDRSQELGDKLDRHWKAEIKNALSHKRHPSLKRALLKTFISDSIFDGILCFFYTFCRSATPVILAQLLLQFEHIAIGAFSQNNTLPYEPSLSDSLLLNRTSREVLSTLANTVDEPVINYDKQFINTNDSDIDNATPVPDSSTSDNLPNFYTNFINDIHCLSALLSFVVLCGVLCDHHAQIRLRMLGARMRTACCSMIYRKTLSLSKRSSNHTSTGYLVNLISNDVSRLDFGFMFAHHLWITPIQVCIITYIMWLKIGNAAFVGVFGLLLMTTPVQLQLSRISSYLRLKIAERTDYRVGIMNEIIHGIQVIKMYAWEIPFIKVVAEARRREVRWIRWASFIRGLNLSISVFVERTTLFITLVACVLMGQAITAQVVFSMAQFFNVLQLTAAIFCSQALLMGAEALMSIRRIEEFLLLDEKDEIISKKIENRSINMPGIVSENSITLKGVTAWWDDSQRKTLEHIDIAIKSGQLCAIIGPVAAGKSSLLHLLLGELPVQEGIVSVNGTISYASQEPWLFSESVRANILFGEEYNRERYNQVVSCCALTSDFKQLQHGDHTHVGENGSALSGGQRARVSLARAVYKTSSIYLLDDPLSAVDAHVGKHLFDEVIGPKGYLAKQRATRLLVTHQVHFLKEADFVIIIDNGQILRQGTYNELANSDLDFAKLLKENYTEKEVKLDSDNESYDEDIPFIDGYNPKYTALKREPSNTSSINSSMNGNVNILPEEEQADGSVAFSIWKQYFASSGTCCYLLFFLLVLLLSQVITSGSDYFVNYWTNQEHLRRYNLETTLTTSQCLRIYGSIIAGVIIMVTLRSYYFVLVNMRASKVLHNKMFSALLSAPMRFFDTNPSGRILNRFSKDMGAIDELLPRAMMDAVQIILVMTGILVMVCLMNPMMIITLVIASCLFSIVLLLYLRPSQDLKRLEGICRSPVFSYLSATFLGISTIRSRSLEKHLSKEFDELQDVHSAIWHLSCAGNSAFALWLDLISTAFVTTLTFSFISMQDSVPSGNVGLAISQALILTGMVQYGIRQLTETMLQMTSVERVLQYTELEKENNPSKKPAPNWPQDGRIQMHGMTLRYDQSLPPVLKTLEIDVRPGWKVGIVGRTGAGKSSLLSALFRLSPIEGEIIIDGLDTGSISLESLRSNISIIPQEPVLFTNTIRNNLDPFQKYNDDSIWRALEYVELKQSIDSLDLMVTESGSNFSVGQRQLICLARAILRNNKILVLDEATANVDPQTDALIQKTIRTRFKQCTVLTIAHRLHTVMDSDRILVMDDGRAKEFDNPHILLQNRSGFLRRMVDATGPNESESLKRMAKITYEKNEKEKAIFSVS